MPVDPIQIIRAATVIGRNDAVFCLGPFPKRVSFTAQQNRALNLVWALKKLRRFNEGDRIAVIGAGLAGVTAAAGFAAHGCTVEIFETHGVAMFRQHQTEHRMAHPTINRWPMAPLETTTCLPFMEWYAESCSEVVRTLDRQLKSFEGRASVRERHSVVDIQTVGTNLVRLTTDPPIKTPPVFRLVLIAIGFGEETPAKDFPAIDYWKEDHLELLRNQRDAPTFIVSGCGDGGLIDALRVVHQHFQKGHLAFEVAALLSGTEVARKIANAEQTARVNKTDKELGKTYRGAITAMVKASTRKNPDLRYSKALELLDVSLLKAPLYLVDKLLDEPYSLNAAPIHKLMIAHAIENGVITFTKGSVERVGDKIKAGGREFEKEPRSKVIIRHGAKFEFGRLLTEAEQKDLSAKQEQLSDDHADASWTTAFPALLDWPKRNVTSAEFIKSRKALAIKAVRKIAVDATLQETAGGFTIQYEAEPPPQNPKRLYGISVKVGNVAMQTGIP